MDYKQCRLEKKIVNGYCVQSAWIPAQFARLGKYVRLKNSDGWKVTFVGDVGYVWAEVNERSRDHKRQRSASDI